MAFKGVYRGANPCGTANFIGLNFSNKMPKNSNEGKVGEFLESRCSASAASVVEAVAAVWKVAKSLSC